MYHESNFKIVGFTRNNDNEEIMKLERFAC